VPLPIAGLLTNFFLNPVLRPILRILTGLGAIPLFRFLLRRVFRVQTSHAEMERDLELWFRGAVLLLAATANMEAFIFGWLQWYERAGDTVWQTFLMRLMLAVGVIESMPDEDVFSILHRGPPKLKLTSRAGWRDAWSRRREILRGIGILHLRRSSPVLVIMAVIFGGQMDRPEDQSHIVVGWCCYGLAIAQYLIIAMITDRDRIAGLLATFDRQASVIRSEILTGAASSAVVTDGDDDADPNIRPGRRD